jgi:hypothetical protein
LPANAAATLETEVEVFKLLDQINALSGEQITVTRTPDGQLKVTGIVDSSQRKTEILNALAAVKNAPGLSIDVQTATEAANRKKQPTTSNEIAVASVTTAEQQLAVEPELRAYFAKRGVAGEALDTEVRQYANSVLDHSRAMRRDALALKQLAERFSPAEVDRLGPVKRDEWRTLLRAKAAAVASDVRSLSSQLSAVLGAHDADSDSSDASDAAAATRAAQRLFGLAAACDSQIIQSFAVRSGGLDATAAVKSVQFWRNLKQMSAIAIELQKL